MPSLFPFGPGDVLVVVSPFTVFTVPTFDGNLVAVLVPSIHPDIGPVPVALQGVDAVVLGADEAGVAGPVNTQELQGPGSCQVDGSRVPGTTCSGTSTIQGVVDGGGGWFTGCQHH